LSDKDMAQFREYEKSMKLYPPGGLWTIYRDDPMNIAFNPFLPAFLLDLIRPTKTTLCELSCPPKAGVTSSNLVGRAIKSMTYGNSAICRMKKV